MKWSEAKEVMPPPARAGFRYIARGLSYQYPHTIEHDGHLVIAFSRSKQTIEIVKLPLDEVDQLGHVSKTCERVQ
ncbi:MAG: hypothetical protein ACYC4N_05875 [Pirellulaceae bacterium]